MSRTAPLQYAPVVVFAYNRPDHLRQTLHALSQADLADESHIQVFADGPRDDAAGPGVEAVRAVLVDPVWPTAFARFQVVFGEQNQGLARAIIGGVTQVIETHGRAIVLEDDLVVSRDFLRFMNEALVYYQPDQTVGSIAGFCPLARPPAGYDHDVMRVPRNCSHGWATWADRWIEVDWTVANAARLKRDPGIRARLNSAGSDRLNRLRHQLAGRINSWSIRFGLWQVATGRDTIYPVVNHVRNTGYDGSGVHTRRGEEVNAHISLSEMPWILSNPPVSPDVLRAFHRVYSGSRLSQLARALRNL